MILAIINCYSLKLAAKVMSVLTVTKVLAVVFVALVGLVVIVKRQTFPDSFKHPFQGIEIDESSGQEPVSVITVTLSLYNVLFAYNGW